MGPRSSLLRRRTGQSLLTLLLCLGAGKASYRQVNLDGPNVSGTVGLTGQTHGSGWLYFYWTGGNLQAQIVNGDTDYSVRVEPDKVLSAQVYLSSFQGGTNAYVYQNLY